MKTYIIDAFNLIHKDKDSKSLFLNDVNLGISSIASKISVFAQRYKSWKFKLILDGKNYEAIKPLANISFVESGDLNADNKIKELINKSKNKKEIKVISSDTEVYNFAKINSCEAITSEDFLKNITNTQTNNSYVHSKSKHKKSEKPTRPSKKEYNELLKAFKDNDLNSDIY